MLKYLLFYKKWNNKNISGKVLHTLLYKEQFKSKKKKSGITFLYLNILLSINNMHLQYHYVII